MPVEKPKTIKLQGKKIRKKTEKNLEIFNILPFILFTKSHYLNYDITNYIAKYKLHYYDYYCKQQQQKNN